ncbi:MAG: alkylphosphonate utilization protein [Thermomonas sp.]|uniref:zinc ribbon domain-containing protein YjdM n=1 Tax=Thermomonas sp. TaxID=1971895 RepID=UPI00261E00DA|nr:zinc ribbon domain-containing protein YjdM [Thermomonas sp.]MCC7097800.1 alkylphosphonate utilization protein [Thermomonas sp.]
MSESVPSPCPQCGSAYTYEDGNRLVCPECGHEWMPGEVASESDAPEVRDAVGNLLADGDAVTVVKDLKVKGASNVLKVGTRIKGIRLIDGTDGHNIDCKIDGFGAMRLKSEFVKKA